jgi:hypothetical protein
VQALAAAVDEIWPTVVWATVAPSSHHHRNVCCRSIDGKTPPRCHLNEYTLQRIWPPGKVISPAVDRLDFDSLWRVRGEGCVATTICLALKLHYAIACCVYKQVVHLVSLNIFHSFKKTARMECVTDSFNWKGAAFHN